MHVATHEAINLYQQRHLHNELTKSSSAFCPPFFTRSADLWQFHLIYAVSIHIMLTAFYTCLLIAFYVLQGVFHCSEPLFRMDCQGAFYQSNGSEQKWSESLRHVYQNHLYTIKQYTYRHILSNIRVEIMTDHLVYTHKYPVKLSVY